MAKINKGVSEMPKVKFRSHEWNASHGNKFALITLSDTSKGDKINANAPKFSVYIGNGKEPLRSRDGKKIANFDIRDVDQKTIAAQFHVTSLTDISLKNLLKEAEDPIKNKSAIKGRADFVEFIGNDAIILNSSTVSRSSTGLKSPTGPGGVHIFTGDRDSITEFPSQPMVLGDNLENEIFSIKQSMDQLGKEVMNVNLSIMKMKLALVAHFHPPFPTPSPTLIAQFVPEMVSLDLMQIINNITDIINQMIKKINATPFVKSDTKFKSKYNTVN